jgi:hypothetical protein
MLRKGATVVGTVAINVGIPISPLAISSQYWEECQQEDARLNRPILQNRRIGRAGLDRAPYLKLLPIDGS